MTALRIGAFAATDAGLVREGNEDNYYRGTTVFAVADGMGGHLAGEVASKTAVRPVEELDGVHFADPESADAALVEAIREANATVVSQASANPDYRGMGTTLTAVLVRDGRLHVAHVGDSRAYLLRRNEPITQLTTDHTLVEQLIQEGRLSRDEAAIHPQRSVITRAIGVEDDVQVDTFPPIALQPGDQVLLCSDGLSGPVDDDTIADILNQTADGQQACEHLLNAANDAGGPDNITVVLLRVEAGPQRQATTPQRHGAMAPAGTGAGLAAPAPGDGEAATQELLADPDATPPSGLAHVPAPQDDAAGAAEPGGRHGATAPAAHPADDGRRRGRTRRAAAILAAVVILTAGVAGAGWLALSRSYFVGVADGQVAIYSGLPQEVASLPLYWLEESSDVDVEELQPRIQEALQDGITVGSLAEARRTVEDYRNEVAERGSPTEEPSP